jgi:hypothetical protein
VAAVNAHEITGRYINKVITHLAVSADWPSANVGPHSYAYLVLVEDHRSE